MKTVLGAQMYTLRDYTKTPKDIDTTLGKVKALGYDAVQMSAWGPIDPKELKSLFDKHQLTMICTHTPTDRIMNDIDAVIEEHKLWDCKYIGMGAMPAEYRGDGDAVRKFVRDIQPICQKIADAGLMFIYHNHHFEFMKVEGKKTIMDILLEETDPAWFQFELDTYWVQAGGADPAQWIRKVAGRMDVIHFKDMEIIASDEGPGVKQIMCEVGEGNLNMMECIRACGEAGVQWHVVEQDVCSRDPFDCLKTSLDNLHRMGMR